MMFSLGQSLSLSPSLSLSVCVYVCNHVINILVHDWRYRNIRSFTKRLLLQLKIEVMVDVVAGNSGTVIGKLNSSEMHYSGPSQR